MREQAVTLDMGRGSRPPIRTSGNPRNRNCDAVEQARSKIAGLVSDQGERSLRKSETYRIEIEAMVALKGNVGLRIVPRTFQSSEATARQTVASIGVDCRPGSFWLSPFGQRTMACYEIAASAFQQ